ncbi:MAG: 50S ribosomal protein L24 [Ardenticatenia bacterium]|uniref:Large ribosomal subunit protein uL24 n=1 Tax=Ardenticatena maritima TaxID=872965 RepID=A0A0N0RFA3_9CHLR|nr:MULTISPECIES: 50S ribosomal protein L24 [Ardenticatena]KPL90037.1 hypothetical protein SE16_00170 [Ardenticatena maritima]RME10468.1 MAG: 50S ribosomal protein L24 [Ardenticatenia bacterium]GAP61900.1 large subunit ribosomal protein L24 [Ardenticatena maritima]
MKIKKGDIVEVITGKDAGKRGEVQRVVRGKFKYGRKKGQKDPNHDRVVVAGVNLVVKHQRPQPGVQQAGRITVEAPIHHSNVMLVCPNCDKPTRVKIDRSEGKKIRICKKCGKPIDK